MTLYDAIMNTYAYYHHLINQCPLKPEVEYEGYTIQFSPDVCHDATLKWHIRAKREGENWRLVGAVSNLFDAQVILSKRYLDDVFKGEENSNGQ